MASDRQYARVPRPTGVFFDPMETRSSRKERVSDRSGCVGEKQRLLFSGLLLSECLEKGEFLSLGR